MLYLEDIKAVLPHRYPFLLVDRIVEMEKGQRVVGLKNVTGNEYFFLGHFPGHPVMPGVLIVEALAQTAVFAVTEEGEARGKLGYFTGIDKLRFRRPVVPGDQLRLEVELLSHKPGRGKVQAWVSAKVRALVGKEVACRGEISFALVDEG